MTPERWKTIEALYTELADLDPPQQEARLAGISDAEIVREVRSLLNESNGEAGADPQFWWSNLVDGAVEKVSQSARRAAAGPRQIGPWRIVASIGKGGMGEVFLAEDLRLGRRVAVKLLSDAIAARPDAIERFRQEARNASALNHPNIVTIHEIGVDQGQQYLVTEYVEGKTVRKLLAHGAMPYARCLEITLQTASALEAAHSAGIVHRDIKPENIMVRPDGFVKVLDFGLAKLLTPPGAEGVTQALDVQPSVTSSGMIVGTPGYMSPEQARGHVADARSDLFSLGAVLHQMLTGKAPFTRATTIETLAALLERDPPSLADAPGVPPEIVPVARKLLIKDPAQRYQTASELMVDLRRLQLKYDSGQLKNQLESQFPAPTRTVEIPAALPPVKAARSRSVPWLVAGSVLLTLAASTMVWRAMQPKQSEWFQSNRLTGIPGNGASRLVVLSPDGRYIGYDTLLPNGNRNLSVRLLAENSVIELVPGATVAYDSLAFSPDGSYLYYVSRKQAGGSGGTLYFVPVLGGTPHKVMENVVGKLAIAPDGSGLAFVRQGSGDKVLVVSSPDGSGLRELLHGKSDFGFVSVDWSTDSRDVVFVEMSDSPTGRDCKILSVSRKGGTPQLLAHPGSLFVYDFAVLPDSSGFVANAFDREAGLPQIWLIPRTGPIRHITHDLSQYSGLSLARDGKRILTSQVGRISELWVVDRNDPAAARMVSEPGRRFDTPAWMHGGTIVATRVEAGKFILWATAQDGQGQRPLLQKSALDLEPSACPDRDELVFASGRGGPYNIWSTSSSSELKQLTFGESDRLPQCIGGGTVLYQAQTGPKRVSMQVPVEGGSPASVSTSNYDQLVSPDGQKVLALTVDEKTRERRITVRSRDKTKLLGTFPYGGRAMAWAPDSQGFADARGPGIATEIWYQPLAGAARQLTRFGRDTIFALSWSPDGRHLVCARGRFNSDMVLIQDARQ